MIRNSDSLRICLLTTQDLDADPFPEDDWPCDPRPFMPEADWHVAVLEGKVASVARVEELIASKRFDLFSRSKVFAPVNVGNMHWCMVMVDVARKEVRYFDSMGAGGEPYLKAMKRYLADEPRAKKGSELEGGWTLTRTTRDTPRQTNGYDCGVFASFCAHYMSLTEQLDFSQDDIQHFRIRMMVDILNKRIHTGGDV